jgi:hypothetical protein
MSSRTGTNFEDELLVSSQDEPEAGWEQDLAVLGSFTLPAEDAALLHIKITDADGISSILR